MNIKHLASGLFSILSLTVLSMAGCAAEPTSESDDVDEMDVENVDSAEEALTTGSVTCEAKGGISAGTYKLYTGIASAGSDAINNDGAYDIRSYCVAEINKRRSTTHTSYQSKTLKPYHVAYSTAVDPNYTVATVAGDGLNTTTQACRAIADAKAGTHSGYGSPLPGATTAFCGADGFTTVASAVSNCMNMIEAESGYSGHQGGLLWDTARPISCALGVITVNGTKKKGISIDWGTPTTKTGRPNGARCKANSYCSSGVCGADGRCKGAANSTCPSAKAQDCTDHPEDPGLCVQKGAACSSGVCNNGKCT